MDRRPRRGVGRAVPRRSIAIGLGMALVMALTLACSPSREPEPEVTLARAEAATRRARTPRVIVTVTEREVVVDGARVLEHPTGEVPPGLAARARLRRPTGMDEADGAELRVHMEALHDLAGLKEDDAGRMDVPELRLRLAAELRFADLLAVMLPIVRAKFGALEFEVATADGVGHFTFRPYTFCACPMPPAPSWCAAPMLFIDAGGVTLVGEADLTPPPGCHKALPMMGETEPRFSAAVDWRHRAIAGPTGACEAASVGAAGLGQLDIAALRARLRALHAAAPGCGWASVRVDHAVPWSIVAPALAALYAEFGEVRTTMVPSDGESATRRAAACVDPLSIADLEAAEPTTPLLGRRGCGAE